MTEPKQEPPAGPSLSARVPEAEGGVFPAEAAGQQVDVALFVGSGITFCNGISQSSVEEPSGRLQQRPPSSVDHSYVYSREEEEGRAYSFGSVIFLMI